VGVRRPVHALRPVHVGVDESGQPTITIHIVVTQESTVAGAAPAAVAVLSAARDARGRGRRRGHETFTWPANDVDRMRAAHRRLRRDYGSPYPDQHGSTGLLTQSALLTGAIAKAMEEPDAWLDTVRDDGRGRRTSARFPEPMAPSMSKVSIVMPADMGNRFDRFVDEMNDDADQIWEPGFRPTRSNLALAAVQFALPHAKKWLPRVEP
jgi:hypothetical protein